MVHSRLYSCVFLYIVVETARTPVRLYLMRVSPYSADAVLAIASRLAVQGGHAAWRH